MVEDEPNDPPAPGSRAPRSHRAVEPLFAALEDESDGETAKPSGTGRSRLGWKLFWAAIVLLALLAVVLNQAF
jgi:hypothetical protein